MFPPQSLALGAAIVNTLEQFIKNTLISYRSGSISLRSRGLHLVKTSCISASQHVNSIIWSKTGNRQEGARGCCCQEPMLLAASSQLTPLSHNSQRSPLHYGRALMTRLLLRGPEYSSLGLSLQYMDLGSTNHNRWHPLCAPHLRCYSTVFPEPHSSSPRASHLPNTEHCVPIRVLLRFSLQNSLWSEFEGLSSFEPTAFISVALTSSHCLAQCAYTLTLLVFSEGAWVLWC